MRADVPNELIAAFAAAVETVLRDWAGVDTTRSPAAAEGPTNVSVAMRLDLGAGWWAVLALPKQTAAALAWRVLADGGEPDQSIVHDCAAELLNVVAGQAKTLLVGTLFHFTFTTPTAPPAGLVTGTVVAFESDCGPLTLRLGPAAGGDGPPGARSED
jgi:chemotaxis protein CheX